MIIDDLEEKDFLDELEILGGTSHLMSLGLTRILPHHKDNPLFYAGEIEGVKELIKITLRRGYMSSEDVSTVLGRPYMAHAPGVNTLLLQGPDPDTMFELLLPEAASMLFNFRRVTPTKTVHGLSVVPFFLGNCSVPLDGAGKPGWRLSVPEERLEEMSKVSWEDDFMTTLFDLATEWQSSFVLFNPTKNQIALVSNLNRCYVPLQLEVLMDLVTFYHKPQ